MVNKAKSRGVTLIELMIVILIAGVLLGLGVPAFDDMIRSSRSTGEFNRFLGDIAFARSEAVTRNQPVVVCPTTNQSACNGTDWDGGWLVLINDGTGEVVRVGAKAKGNINIASKDFASDGSITFGGDGKLEGGNPDDIGRFVICDEGGDKTAKGLAFSPFGQHRKLRDTDRDDIIDYDNGGSQTNVSCS